MKQDEKDAIAKQAVAKAEYDAFQDEAAVAFEKRVNEVMSRDKLTRREAMETAALEYPKEYEEWQTGEPIAG
jgi:hypothetical protein